MKTRKLISCLGMGAAVLASAGLMGCEEEEIYKVNAPADLQDRIDAIAAKNQATSSGDTTNLVVATPTVGSNDFSSGWNSVRSDVFEVAAGKKLVLEFTNYSKGESNWNNWNLCVSKKDEQKAAENDQNDNLYFLLRADNWGWGGSIEKGFDAALKATDYGNEEVSWADWLADMNGAKVVMEIDHSSMGATFVTVKQTGISGKVYTETLTSEGTTKDKYLAWLVCDGSYFEIQKAYLVPSSVKEIEDQLPVSLEISGAPITLEVGNTNFWGTAYATVTYSDGTTADVDSADLTMVVVPDMENVGKKTVAVAYNKTKQGALCQAVVGMYVLEVVNPISSLIVEPINLYYIGNATNVAFSPNMVMVTGVYSDGTSASLDPSVYEVEFTDSLYDAKAAVVKDVVTVTHVTASGNIVTAKGDITIAQSTLPAQTGMVGLEDMSQGFWVPEGFTQDWQIAAGESQSVSFTVNSTSANNWETPCVVLRKASDLTKEFAVVRTDNYGWGDGYKANAKFSTYNDWDFDHFKENITGSKYTVTVVNSGHNTADIIYNVVYANGEKHYQVYRNINVDSSDMQFAILIEKGNMVF